MGVGLLLTTDDVIDEHPLALQIKREQELWIDENLNKDSQFSSLKAHTNLFQDC